MTNKPVILTGIRANNDLHIGNYFGALLPIVDMATKRSNEYRIHMFIPDLHSFTTPIDHDKLQQQILNNVKIFVAAGLPLDNPDIYLYRQSHISAHSELTWILDCFTGFGEMSRMIQFKEKSAGLNKSDNSDDNDHISVGLFNYPVLMAADILLYGAKLIPVGDDQTQHLEFTRNIADRLNNKFAEKFPAGLFNVPFPVNDQHKFFGKDQGLRIRDLQNPQKKMSKSDASNKGIVFMGDDPASAAAKILSAETDSKNNIQYNYDTQPGVSNLLDILTLFGGNKDTYIGQTAYGSLKKDVADRLRTFLEEFQTKYRAIDDKDLINKLEHDENEVRVIANDTLYDVQRAVGLKA